jgi:predicted transcriptional regulator of viral defense system
MTEDSILAYHTALEFYERAYSVHKRILYLSEKDTRVFSFQSVFYQSVRFQSRLVAQEQSGYGVRNAERQGIEIKVTELERTMVDVLDRPDLGGGWEEIWRSLESVEFYDLDRVVEYALILGNATTIAKTGFFLEQHREQLNVNENHLQTLRMHIPKKPHYMIRANRQTGRFFDSWNLIVPEEVVGRSWEELR